MSDKHPYTPAQGHIVQVVNQFRKSFPGVTTADTLRKLGFAPNNESYVLNVLRFLGLIDQDGKRTEIAGKVFSLGADAFPAEFEKVLKKAYGDLFELHHEEAWGLSMEKLISFFRTTDETTAIVGKHQAATFQTLAAYAGHGNLPEPKGTAPKSSSQESQKKTRTAKKSSVVGSVSETPKGEKKKGNDLGLTVRIEINLPADGDQETYDRIFRSIRENLLNE